MIPDDKISRIASYDPSTGIIVWLDRLPDTFGCCPKERNRVASRWNKLRSGKVAGHKNSNGYIVLCIEKKTLQAHRIAWMLHYGEWPKGQIDHINGIRDDNRIENLRVVTSAENAKNKRVLSSNTSGHMGVHFHKGTGKWHARIMSDGVRTHIGAFDSKLDAASAYDACAKKLKFHKNHGRKS